MTQFLDLRYAPVGGGLAAQVNLNQGTTIADYIGLKMSDLQSAIRGRHLLIATHGFNVTRADGIATLSNWDSLLRLSGQSAYPAAFLGLLWPGDSIWAHGLDYPEEPRIADDAGALLATFLDANFQQAASISFASHSLGARVVLATIARMNLPVRRLTLMAGAIDDDCLNSEFQSAITKIGRISVLASRKDTVLSRLFPLGNFVAGILTAGHPPCHPSCHPWWRAAIGHCGPAQPWPANFEAPFEIPDTWNFNHGNYLESDPPPIPVLPLPVNVPPQGTAIPANRARGWQEAFTATFESTRFS